MAALVVLIALAIAIVILLGGFLAVCGSIRRTDRWGSLRPETSTQQRRHLLAYASRWDDNKPAFA